MSKLIESQGSNMKNISFEDSTNYLKSSGLYDHISNIILKLSLEKPENGLDVFENISISLKNKGEQKEETNYQSQSNIEKQHSLLQSSIPSEENRNVSDLLNDSYLLKYGGINVENVIPLSISLRNLSKEHNLSETKFFGIINGLKNNYYVIEAKEADDVLSTLDPSIVPLNAYGFYVSNSVLGPWQKLPHLTPQLLVSSRNIRRLFTGELDAIIGFYPPLSDNTHNNEAYLLRAQLSRISAAISIAPSSFYRLDDESNSRVDPSPNVDVALQKSANKWVHTRSYLYPAGKKSEEGDVVPNFRVASEDNCWSGKLSSNISFDLYPAAVLRNNNWPGSLAVAKGNSSVSIYIGNGIKHINTSFAPINPPSIQNEYVADVDYKYESRDDGESLIIKKPPVDFLPDLSVDPNPKIEAVAEVVESNE